MSLEGCLYVDFHCSSLCMCYLYLCKSKCRPNSHFLLQTGVLRLILVISVKKARFAEHVCSLSAVSSFTFTQLQRFSAGSFPVHPQVYTSCLHTALQQHIRDQFYFYSAVPQQLQFREVRLLFTSVAHSFPACLQRQIWTDNCFWDSDSQ